MVHSVEGFYISTDFCYQIIAPCEYDKNGNATQWDVYGMKDDTDKLVDWSGNITKGNENTLNVEFDCSNVFEETRKEVGDVNKNEEKVENEKEKSNWLNIFKSQNEKTNKQIKEVCTALCVNDTIVWPDNTIWTKIIFSNRQIQVMQAHRYQRLTYTPLTLMFLSFIYSMCKDIYDYIRTMLFKKVD